ncbi:MAG TPA: hypothetical protein PK677_07150 [Acidiphilium sp.]|nr:hypothetical protein [Acidiphilium sp.]HQU23368.1 hypothetical protein [Acidiphilium sp.]
MSSDKLSKTVILLRTHYFDDAVEALADRYQRESGLALVVVVDDSAGVVAVPERFRKIGINRAMLVAAGLVNLDRWGWQCGDYFLILAQQILTEHEYFWMVEPDVLINYSDLSAFFGLFEGDDSDLWVATLGHYGDDWFWYGAMRRFYQGAIGGCFYPVLRISARLIRVIGSVRQAMTELMGLVGDDRVVRIDPTQYPNDEGVTATIGLMAPFVARDFSARGVAYGPESYHLGEPFSATALAQLPADGRLYHPVLSGERLAARFLNLTRDT